METTKEGKIYSFRIRSLGLRSALSSVEPQRGDSVLGAAVLPCVRPHPLRVLRGVVDWSWSPHERRRWSHGVEHVRPKTCRWGENKCVRLGVLLTTFQPLNLSKVNTTYVSQMTSGFKKCHL